ncbi:MAG: hypothetical protein R3230_00110 [Nitrosopumilaceae archaeon]|nr:hypothetical protein [Nitrosopumilaceae archaeon]
MKHIAYKILVTDALEMNAISISSESKQAIIEFLSSDQWCAIYSDNGVVKLSEKNLKDGSNNLVTENSRQSVFIENDQIKTQITECNSVEDMYLIGIPFKRITNDHNNVFELNSQYHDILKSFYNSDLKWLLEKLNCGILDESLINKNNYNKVIREFIENELQ